MLKIGASDELIAAAEKEMGIQFPEGLRAVWRRSNGLDLPGGWHLYPVFDKNEPRKTCGNVCYENTKDRWPYMDLFLVSIADNGTGNQLVLKISGEGFEEKIYFWDHETNKIRGWGKGFDYILAKAEARILNIEKQVARSVKKRRN